MFLLSWECDIIILHIVIDLTKLKKKIHAFLIILKVRNNSSRIGFIDGNKQNLKIIRLSLAEHRTFSMLIRRDVTTF